MTPHETIEFVLKSLPTADEDGWNRLTVSQKQFVAMNIIEGQIGNGGFHAVYYNNCQQYLLQALSGYNAIGANEQAEVVQRVLDIMEDDPWAGPPESWPNPAATNIPECLDIGIYDEIWYETDFNKVDRLKAKYIKSHPGDFNLFIN